MIRKILFVAGLSVSTSGFASSVDNALITAMTGDKSYPGYIFIKADGQVLGKNSAPCSSGSNWDFVLRASDQFGQQAYYQLTAAFAAGKKVKLTGTNRCPVGATEELKRVEML